jgi:hypothetical protein
MDSSPKFKSQKAIRQEMKTKFMLNCAAKKIQKLWRVHFQRLQDEWEQEQDRWDNSGYGCECGDRMCTGCGEGPPISCCMCGSNCRGGDYERWAFCSRRCMVRADSD